MVSGTTMTQAAAPERTIPHEAFAMAALAAVLAAALAWLGPPGTDFAAHVYQRDLLDDHGFALWNNFWYAGRYSFVTYSLLYYPLAVLLGIKLLAVASVATATLAFAVVAAREWGPAARWSNRSFAVVWAGIVLSGAFPFALGTALALLALWALQAGRRGRFALLTVLVARGEPCRVRPPRRRPRRDRPGPRATARRGRAPARDDRGARGDRARSAPALPRRRPLPVLAGRVRGCAASSAAWESSSPGASHRARAALDLRRLPRRLHGGLSRPVLPRREHRAAAVRGDPDGDPDALPAPVAAAACRARGHGARRFVEPDPARGQLREDERDPAADPAYWAPAVEFLRGHLSPSYRVEAVDTVGHWPAAYLPTAGIPIVRGWFRQDDFPLNGLLYGQLDRERYVAWLRSLGVRYVVLPDAPLDYSAKAEGALIGGGRSSLRVAFRSEHTTVFAVPSPRRIVTGPGNARVLAFGQNRITVALGRPGRYRVATNWSPYWTTPAGCITKADDGTVVLTVKRAGIAQLDFDVNARGALAALEGGSRRCAR